jgi:succinate dehydrogenase / fumarate reductase cytochrome b subunit
MVETPSVNRPRPLSPHLQIWRWHITMLTSILHRVAGGALYAGLLFLAGWIFALASGPAAFEAFNGFFGSILGRLILFALTLALFYHMANGVRHLVWDAGHGFAPKTANATGWATLVFAVLASVALWAAILATPDSAPAALTGPGSFSAPLDASRGAADGPIEGVQKP